MLVFINVIIFLAISMILYSMQKKHVSFSKRVMVGLGFGVAFGAVMQAVFGTDSDVTMQSLAWFNVVGDGYVNFLRMIIVPLVFVSIVSSIVNLEDTKTLTRYGGSIIGMLIFTTVIAAIIGIVVTSMSGLVATDVFRGEAEMARAEDLETRVVPTTPQRIVGVIPVNIFNAFAGNGSNPTLSVVIFSILLGISVLGIKRKKPEEAELFIKMMSSIHAVVMRMITLILRITPYGIFALMTVKVAESPIANILNLGVFILISYISLILIFIAQMTVLAVNGLNPITYVKKSLPVLMFAFTAKSSAAALSMNIRTQKEKLGVPDTIASLSASFGASIGQNGCAGLYPAMLAVMIAPTVGINPLDIAFLSQLVILIAISSFGVAGVGGGATFASLIVLSSMGLPVGLAGVLISVEPLIDMGRTTVNVIGAMVSGLVTSKRFGEIDMDLYNSEIKEDTLVS